MPRIAVRIVALIAAAALVSVAMFAVGRDASAASTGYAIDIKLSDDVYSVACDGVDSFRITATVTLDGAPVRGAAVYAQSALVGQTNGHGVLRFDYAPPPKDGYPKSYVFVSALAGAVTVAPQLPRFFSCPFPSGPYALDALLFIDRDEDGVRDSSERPLDRNVHLSLPGNTLQATVDPREYTLNSAGTLATTLYTGGYDQPHRHWSICLAGRDQRHVIGSVNGVPLPTPDRCAELPQLVAGDNSFSIGVVRR